MAESQVVQSYWHLWHDEMGKSHTTRAELSGFELIEYSSPSPEYHCRDLPLPLITELVVLPPNWSSPQHATPKPQWVIVLSGQWYTKTSDGVEVYYQAGDMHFGGDTPIAGVDVSEQGHISMNPSKTENATFMIIQVDGLLKTPRLF